MKKNLILIAFTALLFAACGRSVNPVGTDIAPMLSSGLASPIHLNPIETVVFINDYVMPQFEITHAEAKGHDIRIDQENRLLHITRLPETKSKLAELRLTVEGRILSIIMIASDNEFVTFRIPDNRFRSLRIKGEFNDWNDNMGIAELIDGYWTLTLEIPVGTYQYCLVVNGVDQPNPHNPEIISNGMGGFNSILTVGDMSGTPPSLFTISANRNITIYVENPYKELFVFWQNVRLDERFVRVQNDGTISISIPRNARRLDRSFIRVFTYNDAGMSNDLLIPIQRGRVIKNPNDLTRSDWHRMIMYMLMIDRFYDGDPSNNRPLNIPEVHYMADWFGGDFAGITKKIKDGYFQRLGMNTLWISPITQNPPGAWGLHEELHYGFRTEFTGYHGYWPIYMTVPDHRFGTEEELRTLLRTAHAHNMNVLLDYAANHLHQDSPFVEGRESWFTPLYLPCGTQNIGFWDEHRLTTWFDWFLPKFDFEQEVVSEGLADSLMFWVEQFDFDGFRHDATKHIHERFWRAVTSRMKERMDRPIFQMGETYGSPQLIRSYVGSGMMDGQFDFNLFDAIVNALIDPNGSFVNLNRTMMQSLRTHGFHNLMGIVTGNHDKGRFISYAGGCLRRGEDSKQAGWTREVTVGDASIAFPKLRLLQTFILTTPGIPVIYQGDEFGQPGGDDPDNRRWMQFDGLNADELKTRRNVETLAHLRTNSMPLIFGKYVPLVVEDDVLVFGRFYFGEGVIVGLNKSREARTVEFTLPSAYGGGRRTMTIGALDHAIDKL
ncbi:MAG: alpha-amylase family glycosyl hydrolase [Bacteroidales bacterium]|nr:alpha-amylase family glycosyl hydrolase [Bacteroidales bacterium]